MDHKVIWSKNALNDFELILQFIASDSLIIASALSEEFLRISKTLSTFPRRGRIVPEFKNSDIREVFVKSYRLIYELKKGYINIIAAIHGKRDLKRFWDEEKRGGGKSDLPN